MTDPEEILETIRTSEGTVEVGSFDFCPKNTGYQVNYNRIPLVKETISLQRIKEYQQVANEYNKWKNDEDLTDINGWPNLYGEAYWQSKEHKLSFRTSGASRHNYEAQIRSPQYFDPDCLRRFHNTRDSAVLTILLTLFRYTPAEVGYHHYRQKRVIDQLQEIRGIGGKTAEKLYDYGVRDYEDVLEHKSVIQLNHRTDALKEINRKVRNDISLLRETDFLENYHAQHLAHKV